MESTQEGDEGGAEVGSEPVGVTLGVGSVGVIVGLCDGDEVVCDGVGVGVSVGVREADAEGVADADGAISEGESTTTVAAAIELGDAAGVVGTVAGLVLVAGIVAAAWASCCETTALSAAEASEACETGVVGDVVLGAADVGVLAAAACLAAGVAAAGLFAAEVDRAATVGCDWADAVFAWLGVFVDPSAIVATATATPTAATEP